MVASIRKEPLYIWVGMWCREQFGREWQVKFRSKAQQQAPITVPVPLDCHSVSSSILSSRPCAHGGQVPCPPPLVSQCLVRWTEWEADIILVKECQVSISKSQSHTSVDHPQGIVKSPGHYCRSYLSRHGCSSFNSQYCQHCIFCAAVRSCPSSLGRHCLPSSLPPPPPLWKW